MKKDELEDLFKDSFENFEADVNPSVWKNIQTGLKGAGLGLIGKMLINKIGSNAIVAIVSSAAAVVGTVLVMNGTATKTGTPKTTEPKVIADTQKPTVDEIKNFLSTDEGTAKKETPAVKKETEPVVANEQVTVKTKKDKQQIQSLLSDERVAAISSSCVGGSVPLIINLSNIGSGKINKWTFNDGSKPMVGVNPVKAFDEPGIYTITLTSTSADGKTAVDSIKIEALANSSIVPPSEFSPNGDSVNDVFVFKSKNIVSMKATVYDKDGNAVYDYSGVDGKWDGTNLKGKPVKDGIYLYVISAVGGDGKKFKQEGKIKLTR